MKFPVYLLVLFFSVNSFALTGLDLEGAVKAATTEAQMDLNLDTLVAFDAKVEKNEIFVQLKAQSKFSTNEVLIMKVILITKD